MFGNFQGDLQISGTVLSGAGPFFYDDLFIAKYDPSGNLLWVKRQGGYYSEFATSMTVDANRNIYITGYFDIQTTFDGQIFTPTGTGWFVFITKLDSLGNLVWMNIIDGDNNQQPTDITLDREMNVYATGICAGNSSINGIPLLHSQGVFDCYLVKFNNNGTLLWSKTEGWHYNDYAASLVVDSLNQIYLTGTFNDTTLIGNQILSTDNVWEFTAAGFLAKFDSSGNVLWAKKLSDHTQGYDLKALSNNHILLAGLFSGTAVFNLDTITGNGGNFFVAEFDTAGTEIWVNHAGSHTANMPYGVDANDQGEIYVGGDASFTGSIDSLGVADTIYFGNIHVVGLGAGDVFLAKIVLTTGITVLPITDSKFDVFPNPTENNLNFLLKGFEDQNFSMTIYNSLGKLQAVSTIKIPSSGIIRNVDVNKLQAGIYFINLASDKYFMTSTFTILR